MRSAHGSSCEDSVNFPVASTKSCQHPRILEGKCVDCLKEMGDDGYGVAFTYIHQGLRLSPKEVSRLKSVESKRLLGQRKLHLVLDIDHTLVDALIFPKLKIDQLHRLESLAMADDIIVEGSLLVKLRPFLRTFLKAASSMFETYLYTMGNRKYAKKITKIIDPKGE